MKVILVFSAVLAVGIANEVAEYDPSAVLKLCPGIKLLSCRVPTSGNGNWYLYKGTCSKLGPCGLTNNQKPCECTGVTLQSNSTCGFTAFYEAVVWSYDSKQKKTIETAFTITIADPKSSYAIYIIKEKKTGLSLPVVLLLTDDHQTFFVFVVCQTKQVLIAVKPGSYISEKNKQRIHYALKENGIDEKKLCVFDFKCCSVPKEYREVPYEQI